MKRSDHQQLAVRFVKLLPALVVALTVIASVQCSAAETRVLLIGQGPDSHARGTHEYMAGVHILQHLLSQFDGLNVIVTQADEPWTDGPELIRSSDAIFVFVSEGAKWLSADEKRLDAFQQFASQGGGLSCWHWGMGTREAAPIANFVALFGACHGGPDRRHSVLETSVTLPNADHPVVAGIAPFGIREEFYYALKRHPGAELIPLMTIPIDEQPDMVCWAWNRPDGGRSFGFSGGHFHDHWQRPDYRRLALQSLLWVADHEATAKELDVDVPATLLRPTFTTAAAPQRDRLVDQAIAAMQKAGRYFHDNVAVNGGYVYTYSPDLTVRRGEGIATPTEIWVQPPGTPTVGMAFLRAWEATGDRQHLAAANAAARALIHGQLESGGWSDRVDFDPRGKHTGRYRNGRGNPKGRNYSTFDDDKSQAAMRLLMHVDQALDFKDRDIHEAALFALESALSAQFANGGFPQGWQGPVPDQPIVKASFPEHDWRTEGRIKEYWDHYTLNDGLAGSMAQTLKNAYDIYQDERYLNALRKLGDFLILAQLPEPQPAWAQQYNPRLQPMWARKFEPAAIAGRESEDAVETLMSVYRVTGDPRYLKPIPAALAWMKRSQLPDGSMARFYELQTNRPLYMQRRGDVYSLTYDDSQLPGHYGFKTDSRLEQLEREFELVRSGRWKEPVRSLKRRQQDAERIIAELDDQGRWMSTFRGERLVGQPKFAEGEAYLSSEVFSDNMQTLAEFVRSARANQQ